MIDVLSDLFILRGIPAYIRSDNAPEFLVRAALNRAFSGSRMAAASSGCFFIVFVLVIILLIIVVGVSRRYRIAHLGDEDSSRPTS